MGIGLLQYGEYMYTSGENSQPPKTGDIVIMARSVLQARAGIILRIVVPPGPVWSPGRYEVLWTDGKKTVVRGSSLLKAPAVLVDTKRFYIELDSVVSKALALKSRAMLKGELDELA